MNNLELETKQIMKKYNIYANKSLGQNFLIDEDIVKSIVEKAKISKEDLVIEIGPGLGTLTKYLLEKAGKVLCIELDSRMIKILNERFESLNNFKVINEDVLKVDLNKLIGEEILNLKRVKVVANLPYYITTPIIMKLLEDKINIDSITVMVQKEVADRLTAKPGEDYTGAITYAINYYTIPEKLINVSNTSFIPSPEVESSVIKLNVQTEPTIQVESEEKLFKIIKIAFMQKRKTLLNSLTNGGVFNSKQEAEKVLTNLNINIKIRPEELTLQDFARISNCII